MRDPLEEKFDRHRLGEFGRAAPAAETPIVVSNQVLGGVFEQVLGEWQGTAATELAGAFEMLGDLGADFGDFGALVFPGAGDAG